MMTTITKTMTIAAMLAFCFGSSAAAQNRSVDVAGEPAEQPPAGFDGRQYVDSRGCVYIRAGFDGNVTWIPRMTRNRQVVCGFQPSISGARTASAPPAQATPPARQTAPAPSAPRTVQAPPRNAPSQAYVSAPPPVAVAPQQAPQPTYAPAPQQSYGAGGCTGGSAISGQYMRSNGRYAVRCGPQAENPYTGQIGAQLRVPDARAVSVPQGYQAAWTDDRLNPNRGVQTLTGNAQMTLVWTQEVPRRLVDRNTGRDYTSLVPNMRPTGAQKVPGQRVTIVTPNGNQSYVIVTNRANAAPGSNIRYSTKNVGQ